jgi:hypothetical protein
VSISPEFVDESEDENIETERQPQPEEPPQWAARCLQYYGYSKSGDNTTTEHSDTATLAEHCAYTVQEIPEPETFDESLSMSTCKEWKLAINSDFQALIDKGTWDLVQEEQTVFESK